MKILEFFYTQGEAAEVLGVTPITVWRWIKEGRLDIERVGREVLIPKWEVELLKVSKRHNRRKLKQQNTGRKDMASIS
jgi:excisionase family DNA binding protein